MQAEKDERFRSESKKKAIFNGFNFDMVNVRLKSCTRYPYVFGGAAMLWGYLKPWITGIPRYGDEQYREFVRRFQLRLLGQTINPFHNLFNPDIQKKI